ncbi:probable methyltransferase TARBP1 isoform X5 [Saccopteryx leptura]|uniref:probable methyltransferase TARBP1 isoform X5 n=1 Tax=Saccopteryx leptura TaxID=249018 RepID=UPI00339C5853
MEWVLAEALLKQTQDPRVLLGTLCRGEASAERVETLHFLLQRLENETARGGVDALPEAAREVAAGYLVPLLRGPRARPAGAPDSDPPARPRRRVLRAAGAALRSCARLAGGSSLAATLAEEVLRDLLAVEPAPGVEVGAEAAVEVLTAVGPCLRPREDGPLLERVAQAALSLALAGDGEAAALAAGQLLPELGRSGGAALRAVWGGLLAPGGPGRVGPQLLVLSALAERLLPAPGEREAGPDARRSVRFWAVVQAGLARAGDALTRKRARYLLQRAVEVSAEQGADCTCGSREGNGPSLFWWSENKKDELLKFWENYILILETLEGNQMHVIKPVLPKLNNLFEYAVSEENGLWLFHPSWHMCIYKRMFESENKILTKEGVSHFLEHYETKVLPFSPEFSEFIIGPLMDALSESSLYSRSPGQPIGSGSPLGLKLERFLVTYISLLPKELKSSFLFKFIQKMTSRHWCAVPILFLSKALASVPRCKALGPDGLLALRDVLQCTMITHQILLRGAAQCYLLQTAMNLVDVEKVSVSDISAFLMSLRQEESLGRGTSLWTELCDWLHANESCFGRSSGCSPVGLQEKCSLNAYVKNLVQEYIKSPAWETGESYWMPDWFEAKLVALMTLLAVDVDGMRNQDSEKQRTQSILRTFLDPLLDVLAKLGTNAYMPLPKTDRCLQLLVKLLHTCPVKGSSTEADEVFTLLQDLVVSTTESISKFLLRRLTMNELSSVSDLDCCHLYLQVLTELTDLHLKVGWKRGNPLWRVVSALENASVQYLQDTDRAQELTQGRQIQRVVSMAALAMVCGATDQELELELDPLDAGPTERFLASLPLNQMLQKPHPEDQSSCFEESSSRGWGKIAAQYIHDQWVCLSFLLKKYHSLIPASDGDLLEPTLPAVQRPARTLRSALSALTVLPAEHVLPVFHCMKLLVPKLLASSESVCIEAFDMAWRIISSLSNTQLIFWPNLKAFVRFVFDTEVLAVAAEIKGQAYFKIKEDELVSTSTTRYYVNSQQHRVKNRIWQILLLLSPRFDQNFLNRIIDKIFQAGFINNQASIKYYIEWIIILILHKFPQFLPKFWSYFSYGEENLKTSICTFLSVLPHLDIIIQNVPEKKHILKQALVTVLQWGFSHNFSVRLYALVALKKIWGMCKTLQVEELDALTSVIEFSLNQVENVHGAGNAKKNWQRIQDHFFFASFHPLKDYCLETIFYILPRLSGLVEDEWISTDKFARFTDIPSHTGCLCSSSPTRLHQLKPGDWAQQDAGSNLGETANQSEWADVQKKIIPWKNNVPDLDLELEFQDRAAKLGKSINRLIVVASLIDKPTNLGGLCRTCEVFGASVLVVGNLQCVHNKQFQHLSVSAEQWLPLVEVKPPELMDYLQQKKVEGYTVIGVEQTARSAALTQYCFPEKSLLLLGNEREGIPANLIQQLDICVEIPQQGIIRSLNVHVSGALLIWEYTRQQLHG